MEDLITYQPVFISWHKFKTDTLFLICTFVANYDDNITLYFLFCVDVESRFD